MKMIFTISMISVVGVACGHTQSEAYRYVDNLMDFVAASPEWEDCVDLADTNEVEVLFPTMDALFSCSLSSGCVGYNWTLTERQRAFDDFLIAFSQTNDCELTVRYRTTGAYALQCCIEKSYTNSLPAAKNILRRESAPCKDEALSVLLCFGRPSLEVNDLILSVATNSIVFSLYSRSSAIDRYIRSLMVAGTVDHVVVTNAACMFYRERSLLNNLMSVDALLLHAYADYALSSNRLDVCRTALSLPTLTSMGGAYFVPITNQLMNAAQHLVVIDGLQ